MLGSGAHFLTTDTDVMIPSSLPTFHRLRAGHARCRPFTDYGSVGPDMLALVTSPNPVDQDWVIEGYLE